MPQPPSRRILNGRLRRQPICDVRRSMRHLALRATHQVLLGSIHYQIGSLIMLSKKMTVAVGILLLLFHRRTATNLKPSIVRLLTNIRYFVGALHSLFRIDSFIAGIPEEETLHIQRQENQDLPRRREHRTFDSFDESDLRSMTRLSHSSLHLLKDFLWLPVVMYIHHSRSQTKKSI